MVDQVQADPSSKAAILQIYAPNASCKKKYKFIKHQININGYNCILTDHWQSTTGKIFVFNNTDKKIAESDFSLKPVPEDFSDEWLLTINGRITEHRPYWLTEQT